MGVMPLVPSLAFCYFCKNHLPSLNSSLAKSFCSTYFKLKGFVDPLSGFTVLIFCIDWSQTAVGIQVLVMQFFGGHHVFYASLCFWLNKKADPSKHIFEHVSKSSTFTSPAVSFTFQKHYIKQEKWARLIYSLGQ